ncbi:MAG TPA: hypothetical protein VN702_01595 [Acetobacteraceae bacterium]|nr:hypothetical protein [Acetobacteraceae bacterium]
MSFTLQKGETSVPLAAVQAKVERLDNQRHVVAPDMEHAPAYIRTKGLSKVSDAPDGEWRLAWCSHK